MLSFEERYALLAKKLAEKTPEQLLAELTSYAAVGPIAIHYINKNNTFTQFNNRSIDIKSSDVVTVSYSYLNMNQNFIFNIAAANDITYPDVAALAA